MRAAMHSDRMGSADGSRGQRKQLGTTSARLATTPVSVLFTP